MLRSTPTATLALLLASCASPDARPADNQPVSPYGLFDWRNAPAYTCFPGAPEIVGHFAGPAATDCGVVTTTEIKSSLIEDPLSPASHLLSCARTASGSYVMGHIRSIGSQWSCDLVIARKDQDPVQVSATLRGSQPVATIENCGALGFSPVYLFEAIDCAHDDSLQKEFDRISLEYSDNHY